MKISFLLILALPLFVVSQAFTQVKPGHSVTISERVDHDLYIAGGNVTINAPVYGDLIVAGGTVIINDTVTQDILAAGGTLLINGYVGDDIRSAGGTLTVTSNYIAGDVVIAGGSIHIEKEVVIQGLLLSGGGEITVDGEVKGAVRIAAGQLSMNGNVGGDLDAKGGLIQINGTIEGLSTLAANTIELGQEARFTKDVRYWNEAGFLDFDNSLAGAEATYDPSLELEKSWDWGSAGVFFALLAIWYLGMALLVIFLLHYLFRGTMKSAADTIRSAGLKSLGLGFLFLVGLPVAMVVSAITIIGIPVALVLLACYVLVLLLATSIVSLVTANWINGTYYQSLWGSGKIIFVAFGIFILLKIITFIPFIGGLIMLLLACAAFGGILQQIKWRSYQAGSPD